MKYYSLNKQSPAVGFKEAAINGQAPDKGLYFPEKIPVLGQSFVEELMEMENTEIAFRVIQPYVNGEIPDKELYRIVSEAINFEIPLVKLNDNIYTLELFHGPTLAFKDVGARFMSRCLGYFLREENRKITVLVATSGDTGGAVAHGFYEVEGVEVIILYPSGKVSPVQEKQLTTLGKNINALEVEGSFDDCQLMVKQAFADPEVNKKTWITSANSINVARWLPQQFYYFFAYRQWPDKDNLPVICVPSGNFGNLCAGMLAKQSGLPVRHFIAACNANDVVPRFLLSESFHINRAIPTLSNAMDVGDPNNFIRILEMYDHQFGELKKNLSSFSISDGETLNNIQDVYAQTGYLLDPHGAVGYASLLKYLELNPGLKGIFLETAHPVKFPDALEKITGSRIEIPASLHSMMNREKKSIRMKAGYNFFKEYLMRGQ